ncbi:ATP-binding protein [Pseudomonas mercuritolerans]|uniref:ATP-binding protein n=1 Tax=Pseudomonas mercuritolerans TaxID=2951809 RepID=A0ABT2Y1S2_9PSED|nr:ATP-binding protein [Pseudomonas mercuritolerans]MCV2224898.1 ATP-binding protein [Pseudomonas mercuritolerans]
MSNKNIIKANPTKEFFINMMTRDIATDRAILDLIDNSIDAAIQNEIKNPEIIINATKETFQIKDNCGGLDLEKAKGYAFRFGRPKDAPDTPNSVGQFGVGMKRTLFKLGTKFEVESHHNNTAYNVSVDVDEWVSLEEWHFYFNILEQSDLKSGETRIKVTKLKDETIENFSEETYLNNLMREVSAAYFKQLNNNFKIYFNGVPIKSKDITIKNSEELSLIKKKFTYGNIDITITCGLSERSKYDSGWYIVCNGRLVAEADQTEKTGWGKNGINKFHTDFAFFRGLVEFSCEDASKLPWTTTKTGVDGDSKVYKYALLHMGQCMEPILKFLRERTEENYDWDQAQIESTPLANSIAAANAIRILDAPLSDRFIRPEKIIPPKQDKNNTKISYSIPNDKLEKAKTSLDVKTASQVGRLTFDYYYEYECENE